MLDARTELCQDVGGDVLGGLRHEHDAHALGTDEAHGLDDLTLELLGGVRKQQVRLVEEEHELGTLDVTDLGQGGEEVGEQEHNDRADQGRARGNVPDAEQGDDAAARRIHAHEVSRVEAGSSEELAAALGLERGQGAQDDAGGGLGDATDRGQLVLALVRGQEGDDGAQIGQVHELEALAVRPRENQLERLLLRRVEREGSGQQDRAEVGDLGAHGHARELRIRPTQAQQLNGERGRRPVLTVGRGAAQELLGAGPGLGQARQVALDVAQEHGGTVRGQALGQELEGTGLARARRSGDQEVAVEHGQRHLGTHAGHARTIVDERADRDRGNVPGVGALDLGGESRQLTARGGGRGRGGRGCFGGGILGRGGGLGRFYLAAQRVSCRAGICCLGGLRLGLCGGFLRGGGSGCFELETQGFGLRAGGLSLGGLRRGLRCGELRLQILDVLAHGVAFRLWARCATVLRRYRNSIPWDCSPMRVIHGRGGCGIRPQPLGAPSGYPQGSLFACSPLIPGG